MRILIRLSLALLAVATLSSPAFARIAAIQTTEPLADQSQGSIETATKQAVEVAVKGAIAMGLPRVHLHRAVVVKDVVVVQILATDEAADRQDEQQQDDRQMKGPQSHP
ncbi:MAG TPA: hypothetical protein VGT40_12145 [Methylomirabilota bacterium]|nr:hypothetical protein [Methylomirabilota bacterium]